MADHSLRKVSQPGISYSVVDLNDVPHLFATAMPLANGGFDNQAVDVLQMVEGLITQEGARRSVVQQAVFLSDMTKLGRCRQLMEDFYGHDMPAISYVAQPPCGGKLLAIELLGVGRDCAPSSDTARSVVGRGGRDRGEVEIQRVRPELAIVRHSGITWVHCTSMPLGEDRPMYESARAELEAVCQLLGSAGVHFGQVMRAWYYLGGIVESCGSLTKYQQFNRARTDFFQHVRFPPHPTPAKADGLLYPASTGIGAAGSGLAISAIAMASDHGNLRAVPLENPRQTAACDYSTAYGPQSPKFSRAMVVSCGQFATIFISGTASITDSHSRHLDDAVRQTEETLDNISALIGEDNLSRSGLPGLGASLAGLGLARVYIKRPEDFPAVRAACRRRLGTVPTTYVLADICRDELLVEIEGMAFSRLAAGGDS